MKSFGMDMYLIMKKPNPMYHYICDYCLSECHTYDDFHIKEGDCCGICFEGTIHLLETIKSEDSKSD